MQDLLATCMVTSQPAGADGPLFMLYEQWGECAGLCFRLVGSTWLALLDSDLQADVAHGESYTLWGSVKLCLPSQSKSTHLYLIY